MVEESYIKVCPECGSTNTSTYMIGKGMIGNICENCDFRALIFPEMTEEFAEQYRKKQKE